MNTTETIEAFRRGELDLDCKRIVLRQRKDAGEVYEGPGYIRQTPEGSLTFKVYVTGRENVNPLEYFNSRLQGIAGQLHSPDLFYDLTAIAHDGTIWNATHILPNFNWDMRDMSVIGVGHMQSLLGELGGSSESSYYLRLHFFSEYEVPLDLFSPMTEHGSEYRVRDRSEFKACNCDFEVRKRDGSGETIFEVTSDQVFPPAFEARIQEALQYLTGKSAFWRARVERRGNKLAVELLSPWRTSKGTQFDPPISRGSIDFMKRGWDLFARYLAYVVTHTEGKHWNPVAYHLYNACESSAGSVDAWAVGISVAVEAVASLIQLPRDEAQAARVALLQERMFEFADAQTDLATVSSRMKGLIGSMGNNRPQDTLYALVATGHADKAYVKAWEELRNRHVHPKPKDLKTLQGVDYQELLDRIHRTEVVLRQLTFYLIGYEGPYTDYGAHNFPSKDYPAAPPGTPSDQNPDTAPDAGSVSPGSTPQQGSPVKRLSALALYSVMAGLGFCLVDALGRAFGDRFLGLPNAHLSSPAGYVVMILFLAAVAGMIYGVSLGIDKVFFEPLDDKALARRLEKAALIVGLTFGGLVPVN